MADNGDLLFVYGTLLSRDPGATGRTQRQRLARETQYVGGGASPGQLYDLGRYPGLVLADGAGARVHGEVLALPEPARTLRWLDDYEGLVPGQHPHNEYERRRIPVTLETGEVVEAWAYVYRRPVETARLIAGGRWLDR